MTTSVDYRSGSLIGGIFILLIGIILAALGWSAAIWVFAVLTVLAGILAIVGVTNTDKTTGVIEIILAIILLVLCETHIIDNFIGIIVGIFIALFGIVILVSAKMTAEKKNIALAIIVGLLLIIAGIVMVYYNNASGDLTSKIVGIILVIAGIVDIVKGIKG